MKNHFILTAIILSVSLSTASAKAVSRPILWNLERLAEVKQNPDLEKARKMLLSKADKYLQEADATVVKDDKPFVPDPHCYVSCGPYWWPDPENPDGPYIRRDGQVNPKLRDLDNKAEDRMRGKIMYCAVAFYLTGDTKYHDAAASQIKTWFINPETRMLPNFDYAQVIPGHNGNRGRCYGLIDAYNFIQTMDAIDFLNSCRKIDSGTMAGIRKWYGEFAAWMQTSELGIKEKNTVNNHGLAYDVLLSRMLVFTGDRPGADKIAEEFRQARLEKHIMEDGSQPHELARTNGMGYSIYNLTHMVDFCIMRESLGDHYYSANKDLINKAFEYIFQFDGKPETFPYREISGKVQQGINNVKAQWFRLNRLKGGENAGDRFDVDHYQSLGSILK